MYLRVNTTCANNTHQTLVNHMVQKSCLFSFFLPTKTQKNPNLRITYVGNSDTSTKRGKIYKDDPQTTKELKKKGCYTMKSELITFLLCVWWLNWFSVLFVVIFKGVKKLMK